MEFKKLKIEVLKLLCNEEKNYIEDGDVEEYFFNYLHSCVEFIINDLSKKEMFEISDFLGFNPDGEGFLVCNLKSCYIPNDFTVRKKFLIRKILGVLDYEKYLKYKEETRIINKIKDF